MNYEQELVEKARICLSCTSRQTRRACGSNDAIFAIRAAKLRHSIKVICFEPLEHLLRDRDVVTELYRILRRGRRLAVCCPNRLHPAVSGGGSRYQRIGKARANAARSYRVKSRVEIGAPTVN